MLQGLITIEGERIPFEKIDISRSMQLFGTPEQLIEILIEEELSNYHRQHPEEVTISSVILCPREEWIKRRFRWYASPKDLWYSFRGRFVHSILEKYPKKGWIKEKRFWKELEGVTISGQIDAYSIKERDIVDYKSGMDQKVRKIARKPEADPHHIWQVSAYAWLIYGGRDESSQVYNLQPKQAHIYYLSFSEYVVVPVKLKSQKETEAYLSLRVVELDRALKEGIPPPIRKEVVELWGGKKCKVYCPVKEICRKLA